MIFIFVLKTIIIPIPNNTVVISPVEKLPPPTTTANSKEKTKYTILITFFLAKYILIISEINTNEKEYIRVYASAPFHQKNASCLSTTSCIDKNNIIQDIITANRLSNPNELKSVIIIKNVDTINDKRIITVVKK